MTAMTTIQTQSILYEDGDCDGYLFVENQGKGEKNVMILLEIVMTMMITVNQLVLDFPDRVEFIVDGTLVDTFAFSGSYSSKTICVEGYHVSIEYDLSSSYYSVFLSFDGEFYSTKMVLLLVYYIVKKSVLWVIVMIAILLSLNSILIAMVY